MGSRSRIMALGLGWLVWIWLLAIVSSGLLPWLSGPHSWSYDVERRVTPLTRWDSGWYLGMAEAGYQAPPTRVGQATNHAFFPLYPLLMRAVARATGVETSLAGNLISAASFLGALFLFCGWVSRRWGEERALPAALGLLLFPTSFFFATVYTESLLLFLALAAVTATESDRPVLAFASGFLTGLTRISGIVLAPYLFLAAYSRAREAGLSRGRAFRSAVLPGVSPLAGFGAFCLYFWYRFGDPLLFIRAQHNWATEDKTVSQGPWLIVRTFLEDVSTGRLLHKSPARTLEGIFLLLFAYLAYRLLREKRRPEALYVFLTVAIVFASGTLESAGRYVLPAFPAFAVIGALVRYRRLFPGLLAVSAVVQAAYVFVFVHWLWAG